MDSRGSISRWIDQLRNGGDTEVAQVELWNRFFARLLRLASKQFQQSRTPLGDEEDVVVAALLACLTAIQNGHYPKITDRDSFWNLLLRVAERKAIDANRRIMAKKRGGNEGIVHQSSLTPSRDSGSLLDEIAGKEPTPEFAMIFTDELQRLMMLLDERHRRVATMRVEGYTNREIAAALGRSVSAVDRYIRFIRELWCQELLDDPL